MTKGLAALLGCVVIAVLVLGSVTGYPAAAAAKPVPQEPRASKVAYIILERAADIAVALKAEGARETLPSRTATALSDPLLRVSVRAEMLVEFHSAGAIGSQQIRDLEARNGRVVISTADLSWSKGVPAPGGLGVIVAWMPYDQIEAAAEALPWVVAVRPVEDNPPDEGAFLSEGVALHRADDLQALGIDGAGVIVGAISDGINNLAAAQASGDLPATVTVPPGCTTGNGDEGTAMLEIVHDMAPGAALQFCATGGGVVNHTNAQLNLVAGGAAIITEDIPFDGEPAFQKGLAATTGDAIAAAGVSMHSSAGNMGARHAARVLATGTGGGPDGQAGPFAGCPAGFQPGNVVAIAPGGDTTFDVQVQPGTTGATLSVTLQWSEPRAIFPTAGAGGFTDLNLYVMDAGLTQCLGSSVGVQGNGAGDTIEQVSVNFAAGGNVGVKFVVDVQTQPAGVSAPTIDLRWRGAVAVDASTRAGSLNPDANYTGPATSSAAANAGASTDPATVGLEAFSSGGPVQLLLTTVCPGGVYPCPGNPVAGPAALTFGAPAWTAADGVSVSGVGGFGSGTCPAVNQGDCRFFGTSASTPHAAACDALIRSNVPGIGVAGVNTRLAASALDRGDAGFDNSWGAGVIDCLAAAIQADLALTKSDLPDPVAAGAQLTYALQVTNNGPDFSPELEVTDTLPAGVSFASSPQGCTETAPGSGIVTCTATGLAAGDSVAFDIVTLVDADLVYIAGGPATITNSASVTGLGLDPDPANNSATEDTLVVAEADLEIVSFELVDPPAEVLVGEDVEITLRKVITNRGPSAPIDVAVTQAGTAPPDSTVTPAVAVSQEPALGLNELREVLETFTITCGGYSHHTFTFTNEIQPLHPADTDPDQSDNFASVDLDVECVVPVALNIKPGSYPNSINPDNKGEIPLAVLTTVAGEYGLPLAFDAGWINPLTVRFGPRALVWNETGGAFEVHGRGHLEDAYELDELTLDGDLDLVLHFNTHATGIMRGDVEACVKGEWVDGGGVVHKFFGCDSVRTVPPF